MKRFFLFLTALATGWMLLPVFADDESKPAPATASPQQLEEFATDVTLPFWKQTTITESLFFVAADEKSQPASALLFQPTKIRQIQNAKRDTTYEEGRDYVYDQKTNRILLPSGSRILFMTDEQLHPLMTSETPKIAVRQPGALRGIYFDNVAGYHQRQLEITYECEPGQWKGYVPNFAGASLPRLTAKLKTAEPVTLLLCGDSISEGYNASKFGGAPPYCPAYGELVALGLQKQFGNRVNFTNYAVGGWSTPRGLQQVREERIGKQQPDLVMIAFGMNDVFAKNAVSYQQNIRQMMAEIREDAPEAEFVLVASMLGNAEWGMPMEQFPLYRDALQQLCDENRGVVLADMTRIWEELLKHKSFYDLTGNGVNHPNDFGHKIYAETILSLLIPAE